LGKNKKGFLKFSFIALLFLALILAWLSFGDRGFVHLYRMEKSRQAYREKIISLEKENQKLLDEIGRLRTDRDYIESVARRELGFIKDDEILYRLGKGEDKQGLEEKRGEKTKGE
jgi:cell division protein FtsB